MPERQEQVDGSRPIECPRCGYDQRGVVLTWRDSCPLEGQCAECGLKWPWMEVLSESRPPRWCIESATKWRQVPGKTMRTIVMAARPWRFWSALKMSHSIRATRILGFLGVLVVLLYPCIGFVAGWNAARFCTGWNASSSQTVLTSVYTAALPFADRAPAWYFQPPRHPWLTPRFYARFVSDWFSVVNFEIAVATGDLYYLRSNQAVLTACALTILTPVSFLALPVSRKKAKVQWRHLARITAYSLIVPWLVLMFSWLRSCMTSSNVNPSSWNSWQMHHKFVIMLCLAGVPGCLIIWWSAATRNYLKMPHAWGVAALAVVMTVLATALVITVSVLLSI